MRPAYQMDGDKQMPFVNVKVIEGVFDGAQKAEMVKTLTEAMVRIEGENMRSVTWWWSRRSRAVTGVSAGIR